MATLVLTVIGDDRAGLVNALADVVTAHGGNWERSQLAELAGKFAGIVQVNVADERADELAAALQPLRGLLEVSLHPGVGAPVEAAQRIQVDLVGNDHPGIVRDVSGVLTRHGVSIERLITETREAPMAGGLLFEAHLTAPMPGDRDLAGLQADLEKLATEIVVDITVAAG
ncbi:MAG: ACT domain-containing protein [Micropruina sp.]|uniref:glycine cleavage system protein R n=1 Tax=Micropruina sp. TaxID=2737536 RepID=UPI0039E353F6